MNGFITKQTIMEAWVFLREKNSTIPNDTLDFMRDSALEKLDKIEKHYVDFTCKDCGVEWRIQYGNQVLNNCPCCSSPNIKASMD